MGVDCLLDLLREDDEVTTYQTQIGGRVNNNLSFDHLHFKDISLTLLYLHEKCRSLAAPLT